MTPTTVTIWMLLVATSPDARGNFWKTDAVPTIAYESQASCAKAADYGDARTTWKHFCDPTKLRKD